MAGGPVEGFGEEIGPGFACLHRTDNIAEASITLPRKTAGRTTPGSRHHCWCCRPGPVPPRIPIPGKTGVNPRDTFIRYNSGVVFACIVCIASILAQRNEMKPSRTISIDRSNDQTIEQNNRWRKEGTNHSSCAPAIDQTKQKNKKEPPRNTTARTATASADTNPPPTRRG